MLTELLPELALPGNQHLLEQLEAMVLSHRLPHGIIIEGSSPQLNGQLARLLARAHLCECEQPLAGECLPCRKLLSSGCHPDLIQVEGSGKTGAISVGSIRELHGRAALISSEAKGVVCLLENADTMESAAQNAFLKLFEEPPEGVMLIITCCSALKLLETVRSRAVLLRAVWPKESLNSSEAEAKLQSLAEDFALSLTDKQDNKALLVAAYFSKNRKDASGARAEMRIFLELLREVFRRALLIGTGAQRLLPAADSTAQALSATFAPECLMAMLGELDDIEAARRTNASMPLLTAAMCVRLRRAAGR